MPQQEKNRQFAVDVVRRLKEAGFTALWAGGCVRDFLLGRQPKDYDVASDARPDDVRKLFGHRRTLAVGASFGVIIVRAPRGVEDVEVATFRTEGPYLDGRRPEHVAFTSPEEDAQRRDFTINGLFYDPIDKKVFDFVDGERDLGEGIVRAIGDPHDRMTEDKLRMLRAVRFSATLEFELDAVTADAVRNMAAEMLVVSAERIAQELRRMLVDRHRMRAMQLTTDVGLLHVILPEVASSNEETDSPQWMRTLHMLDRLEEPSFELAMATLLHAVCVEGHATDLAAATKVVHAICRRLKLSNQEADDICWLFAHQRRLSDAPNLSTAALKRLMAKRSIADLIALYRVDTLARGADLTAVVFCEEYLRSTPREEIDPPPLLTGDILIAHGFQPGPQFKTILDTVRDSQLNGEITTADEALRLAQTLTRTET
ncbi:MAG: CCA tRNA nucleotidyltransferase [Planctomycetaceae bacterium]|jgi:poly(A) polymerase|nr:CCA tRNA nucleotidyltransferase [Planctomycetaceae bacterium]MBT6154497.1 CCA tRNA nucleotidyltransferase [Planctomycetaceae bacterium]MBT6486527.1 CCA tRNA nucleotidyltransferase [Planctomycetaceae bacterium]MBT6497954.1 CCA tRNA nucleotidyltransferase [Planctomycetaceae bacterium]